MLGRTHKLRVGGGGVIATLPLGSCCVTIFRKYLNSVDSLSWDLQDKVNIISCGAAGGL